VTWKSAAQMVAVIAATCRVAEPVAALLGGKLNWQRAAKHDTVNKSPSMVSYADEIPSGVLDDADTPPALHRPAKNETFRR